MRLEHNNGTFYFSSVFAKSKCNFELICNLSKFVANKRKWNCFFWFFYQCNAANIQDGLVHIWSEKHKYEIGEKFIFWTYLKEPLWAPISILTSLYFRLKGHPFSSTSSSYGICISGVSFWLWVQKKWKWAQELAFSDWFQNFLCSQ